MIQNKLGFSNKKDADTIVIEITQLLQLVGNRYDYFSLEGI
jgi:hypothetical protein